MRAKTYADVPFPSSSSSTRSKGHPPRRREIGGILLLATGLFATLALVSFHVGRDPLMGPGGAAAAAWLYGSAGLTAYLIIAGMLVAAVRCFRGRRVVDGFREALGTLLLLGAAATLLYLPFAGSDVVQHGPGGLLGEWLGELTAGFIGVVGAALVGATMLAVSLLLLTEISIREALVILAWAGRHAGRGIAAGARATWRVIRATLPERDDRGEAGDPGEDPALDPEVATDPGETIAVVEPVRPSPSFDDQEGIPDARDAEDSEAVRFGVAKAVTPPSAARAAMAAIVAEVAAHEPALDRSDDTDPDLRAPSHEEGGRATAAPDDDDDAVAAAAAAPPPDAPIIVEPASIARLRQRQEHPGAVASSTGAETESSDRRSGEDKEKDREKAREKDGRGFIKLNEGAFELPGADLLEYIPPQAPDMDKQGLYEMAERLEQAMSNYGVRGKVKEIHMGPVVTMYEFAPAPGTRTGKIANLEKDLAMALEAQAVRIVAPIPGKAVVGVEVPNRTRETVYLKEILQDDCFTTASSKLQVALGKDIKGAPVSVNLAKMPHLLVAGTTGSGKSVAVNGMITSILYNATPEEARFIMVDPKMLELSIYEGIPHLLLPVVTDPKKANLALRWAVDEMERRYELLAKTGVRDIAGYNAKVASATGAGPKPSDAAAGAANKKIRVVLAGPDGSEQEVDLDADSEITVAEAADGDTGGIVDVVPPSDEDLSDQQAAAQAARESATAEPPPEKLPYIVIVIDEFADLMMVAPKDVETSVARLAQKARAAGLHLILATQRPSVDVITGLIKANFPSRIALQVASKIDSRTILDQPGAETLLGNGDMLFSDRGTKLRRIHGAFLSDDEVHRVVDFLKKQAKPVYDMDILKPREEESEDGAPPDDFHDELYDQAVAIVCDTRQASVSYIQRRLQIGYNRAARMVERMERDGIVGPTNGAKPREVLAPAGEYLTSPTA